MKYSFTSRIRYSEIGEDGNLTLPGLINYFQDCSTFQSEDIGVGLDVLSKKKKAWILTYWQIVIDHYPKMNDKIQVSTWASKFKGMVADSCEPLSIHRRRSEDHDMGERLQRISGHA